MVDGSVYTMFSNVNIKKSINARPQTAVGNMRKAGANNDGSDDDQFDVI